MPGGGFTAGLTTTSDPLSGSVEFLASQHYQVKRGGITVDASVISADAEGNKVIKGGTVMGKVTANGKYAPYASGATDGTETPVGILFAGDINVRDGDTVAGLLLHGSVIEARCTGVTAAAKTALGSRIIFQ